MTSNLQCAPLLLLVLHHQLGTSDWLLAHPALAPGRRYIDDAMDAEAYESQTFDECEHIAWSC